MVMISPEKRHLIGLATSPVEERDLSQSVRGVGTVIHDETRLARIAPRFGGWVRAVQVNYTGQAVNKGDPLFTVYSPELYTAGNDYLLALRQLRSATNDPVRLQAAQSLIEAARRRLELLQVGDEQVRAIEQSGRPSDELQIVAPLSGHVLTKNAVEGQAFNAGETLYEIADLSHLWVRATVFESDLGAIRVGQEARILFPHLDNRSVESDVTFVYPHIDPLTRRGEVRLELENPDHVYRPDMWASVEIEVSKGRALTVPASAVIDTGTRQIAFVDGEDHHLEPREVKIGMRTDDYLQVLDGLEAGERVVTRALFLVDSESQLKAVVSGMGSPSH
jgi:Cu(I)/Ag(I) efflux system membrane fusion protein